MFARSASGALLSVQSATLSIVGSGWGQEQICFQCSGCPHCQWFAATLTVLELELRSQSIDDAHDACTACTPRFDASEAADISYSPWPHFVHGRSERGLAEMAPAQGASAQAEHRLQHSYH